MNRLVSGLMALAVVTVVALPTDASARGWFVRICRAKTEASEIKVWVGKEGGQDATLLKNWVSSEVELEFDLPAELAAAPKIWIKGEPVPPDGVSYLCVFYGDQVVRHLAFNDVIIRELSQGDRDDECACAKGQ